jgi:uncharacterized protein
MAGEEHYLIRYPAGLRARPHRHTAAQTIVVLEGHLSVNGTHVGPGAYCHFPPGEPMLDEPVEGESCVSVSIFHRSRRRRDARRRLTEDGVRAAGPGVGGAAYGSRVDVIELEGPGGRWRVIVPATRRERIRGLRGRPPPGPREGLLLPRCRSVHTVGMTFPITVVHLDARYRVVRVRVVPPGRVVVPVGGAAHVLECGEASALGVGDRFRPRARAGPAGPRHPRPRRPAA